MKLQHQQGVRAHGTARPQRTTAVCVVARSTRMKEVSTSMREMRAQMEKDEQLSVLMAGLRGSNIDVSDFAGRDVKMNLVEYHRSAGDTEALPLSYDPDAIASYWSRRPVSIATRVTQLAGIAGGFVSSLLWDLMRGRLAERELARAVELRNIMTSLGPAYIKLGQALSIRPDLLSPAAMIEMQKLCDKVPSFDSAIAMQVIEDELGRPWQDIYTELSPEPIAAASLGQVYKGRLAGGEVVAVKVQRPGVLETVTIDLFIIRSIGLAIRKYLPDLTKRADIVALLDEWASRFFEELDYVKEGNNATIFAEQMAADLPQVVIPKTYTEFTSRRVLTTEWLDGEKLSQSKADDVGELVNVGVICFLKQLLDTGFFHADPHPGNLIRTPDGRLAILDFGLMSEVDDNIKYGMIEAISHLIHRDYNAIVKDFVTLDFIPEGTDLRPILPVLAKVFDRALEGGGAKNINFQELASDLAQITFDYPFRIPPYFALIIRAIGVLEGIALVGNPDFAIVDEAYPYIAQRLLTDDSPRLREALRYMVYGKRGVFDADRLIDLLTALEDFHVASHSAEGDMRTNNLPNLLPPQAAASGRGGFTSTMPDDPSASSTSASSPSSSAPPRLSLPFPFPRSDGSDAVGGGGAPFPFPVPAIWGTGIPFPGGAVGLSLFESSPVGQLLAGAMQAAQGAQSSGGLAYAGAAAGAGSGQTREALRFMVSPQGAWFRSFVMDELVKSVDALSRDQAAALATRLGLGDVHVPVLLPGAKRPLPLAPKVSEEDKVLVDNVVKLVEFFTRGKVARQEGQGALFASASPINAQMVSDVLPVLPALATEILPELTQRLASRMAARLIRELYM